MGDEEARAYKLAANQSRFRRSNERLQRAAYSHRFKADDRVPFLCECADPGCFEAVWLSTSEFEQVRAYPNRFVLVAGHEEEDTPHERIIEAENGYAIVEKVGAVGLEAIRLDSRGRSATPASPAEHLR
jgi:hypothetical protein